MSHNSQPVAPRQIVRKYTSTLVGRKRAHIAYFNTVFLWQDNCTHISIRFILNAMEQLHAPEPVHHGEYEQLQGFDIIASQQGTGMNLAYFLADTCWQAQDK